MPYGVTLANQAEAMNLALWATLAGALLILSALGGSVLARLPLSMTMLYLAVGVALSPLGWGGAVFGPTSHSAVLEHMTEIVVLISLFSCGLKLSAGIGDRRWRLPLRLALTSMLVTVGLVTAIGVFLLGLPLGAAVLLGGILAPTDPVLASDVQVASPADRDDLRFALTGEGGFNDGTAFPIVLLGLGLLGLHDIGEGGLRWWTVDVLWAGAGGLAIGAALGAAVGRLVLYLRRTHKEAVGLDNFLALGLIGLAYGLALLSHTYGFLAVFAAGVALRRVERRASAGEVALPAVLPQAGSAPSADTLATHPNHAAAFMAHAMLSFNEQIERIGEVAAVIALGALLWAVDWSLLPWWFVPLLLLVVRPISVAVGLAGSNTSASQRGLIGWFGIRGIGSMYYLMVSINHGIGTQLASVLTCLTLSVVVTSIIVHGISVTPLMSLYRRTA